MKRILLAIIFSLLSTTTSYADLNDEIKVSDLQHIVTKRGAGYVFLSFKMNVENAVRLLAQK